MRRLVIAFATLAAVLASLSSSPAADPPRPIQLLIITGDNVPAHDWQGTTRLFKEFLSDGGRINVEVTATPAKDLTDENLAKYDVLLLNYKDTNAQNSDTR